MSKGDAISKLDANLRKQIKRPQTSKADWVKCAEQQGRDLRKYAAENEKLKEALKEIKQVEDIWDDWIPECDVCCKVQDIAEQALKGE